MYQQNPATLYTDSLRPASDGGWCGCFTLTRQASPQQQCLPASGCSMAFVGRDTSRAPRETAGGAPSRFPAIQHHNELAAGWASASGSDASPPRPGHVRQHAPLPRPPPGAPPPAHYQQLALPKLSPLQTAAGSGKARADGGSSGSGVSSPRARAPNTPPPHSPSLLSGSSPSKASSGSGRDGRAAPGANRNLPAPCPPAVVRGACKLGQPEQAGLALALGLGLGLGPGLQLLAGQGAAAGEGAPTRRRWHQWGWTPQCPLAPVWTPGDPGEP